ncbi:hypothetical protein [Klebsiella michiganensis]|uniref:hypothetical protein n=1 Tax=Klebsiella michiganensis TaxID=1134687 RepID=UPI0034D1EB5E
MRFFTLLFMLIVIAACNDKSQEAQVFAQSEIKSLLKDPASAEFKSLTVNRIEQEDNHASMVHVCGLVNAKNSFGAFTGFSNFVVSYLDSPSPEVLHKEISSPGAASSTHSEYWLRYCTAEK